MSDIRNQHGVFSWTEYLTRDVEAAKAFYGKVFGWTFEAMPIPQGGTYHVLKSQDYMQGGIMMMPPPVPPEAPSHWLTYVTVSDIEATVKAVLDAGGKVLHRLDLPDVGKMAVIEDPQGAKISAIQYAKGFSPERLDDSPPVAASR